MFSTIPLGVLLIVSAPRQPADDHATLIEAVRTLAGQQLYQTYLNLENVVELGFFGLREDRDLTRMVRGCIEAAEEAEQQLARVAKLKELSQEDAAMFARMRSVAKLLADQGNSLRTYWETGVAAHWKDSEASRKAAYKELEDLLDLKGTKGIAPKPREVGKK